MGSTAIFPSLLVFGSQTNPPSPAVLAELRHVLVDNPKLAGLRKAVDDLPKFWQSLTKFDPNLSIVPGAKYLGDLERWIDDRVPAVNTETLPNIYSLPLSVLLQIALYIRYLNGLEVNNPHCFVLERVKAGGIQGFCIGFLTAIVVACSETEEDIAAIGAICLRLALCAGAYVDRDGYFSEPPNQTRCIAVRWQPGSFEREDLVNLVQNYTGVRLKPIVIIQTADFTKAYISCFNDEACVTVTAQASDIAGMTESFQSRGLRVAPVHVQGRFHSMVHSSAVEKLYSFCNSLDKMRLPPVDHVQVPLRSTMDGEIITSGSLCRIALESILLKPPEWYKTVKIAVSQLQGDHCVAVLAGFASDMPASLLQSSLQVLSLGTLEKSNAKRPPKLSTVNGVSNGLPNGAHTNGIHTNGTLPKTQPLESEYPPHSVAIVGMASRFSGADTLDEFWKLILSGTSVVEPAPERLKLPTTGDYANTKWWGTFLRDPYTFDHKFFKKSSREALAWDPQMRVLLEVAYEALESSGYFGTTSKSVPTDYGCYIGAVMSNWYDNVQCHPVSAYNTIGTSRPFFSGALSHYFGWTGPALTIDTACSSSLVAINAACRAIMSGECSRAIAGGTNIFTSPFDYRNLQSAGFLSPTGGCKPFDASGDGYCRGEGVGLVILKPLADAIKENDNILGVIVGSAVNQNQNGSNITVPHSGSQINLYNKVMRLAGITPDLVSYIEAHGTGTGVGDPIESLSIRQAFGGPKRDQTLQFGSVKGNVGHTESTAGVAGLIKVLLMMQHGKIPPQASFWSLNPNIPPLEPDRMEISRSVQAWKSPLKLACVNSYGAAGNNAAIMVRQPPVIRSPKATSQLLKYPLFFSAASANSLSMYCEKLLRTVKDLAAQQASETLLADLTFNLADRANHSLAHQFSTTVTDVADIEKKLTDAASGTNNFKSEVQQSLKPVVLVFGGQESDFVGLSEELYQASSVFRKHLDQCNDTVMELGYDGIFPEIFQRTRISNLITLHAALFSVQYSSAKTWMECGLEVSAVVGHSFGQLTALCVSGCLSIKDAIKLVAGRAAIMLKYWGPERGCMMWLGANRQNVSQILGSVNAGLYGDDLEIACCNGPESLVAVGSAYAIESLEKFISGNPSLRDSVRVKKLKVTNGFHSKFTDPLLPHIMELAKSLMWNKPTIHLETCDEIRTNAEPDFRLPAEHTRKPVFFEQAVNRLAQRHTSSTWLEAGAGPSFMNLVLGCLSSNQTQGDLLLAPQLAATNATSSLAEITISLWKAGHGTQFWPFHRSQKQQYSFLSLPPYQFEKSRHWLPYIDRMDVAAPPEPVVEEAITHELLTFVMFQDGSKNEAVFRVNPLSDRYQFLVNGHVMAGQALAPASLSFELVARAALYLQDDLASASYVPCVESLHMKSPIGLDTSKEILLTLTKIPEPRPSWSFTVTTHDLGNNNGVRFEHTSGSVYLEKKDDIRAAQNFKRFETLLGSRQKEIMNNPDAEKMKGKHIYRAFNHIVFYGEQFRGIKDVSCVKLEAAGKVSISVDPDAAPDQRLCDTPITDSFMQFAGFLVNYFNNSSMDDVYVCHMMERIEIGARFNPDAKEWVVYSTMTEEGDKAASADVYVFERDSGRMVMAALGFRFSRMNQSALARVLRGVNGRKESEPASMPASRDPVPIETSDSSTTGPASKRKELLDVLHNVTDMPPEDIKDESTLDDLGIDSLMATELLNDIRSTFGLAIDLTTFLFFHDVREVWTYLDEKLGVASSTAPAEDQPSPKEPEVSRQNGIAPVTTSSNEKLPDTPLSMPSPVDTSSIPSITDARKDFEEIQFAYDELSIETKAANFWTQVYPDQARLVLANVVEQFAVLGCDLKALQQGDAVPKLQPEDRHKKLVRQLYSVMEDAHLITAHGDGFLRTKVPVDSTPAETIYQEILQAHPVDANVHNLVKVIGSQLAACLTGSKDGLQLIFGDKTNKESLADVYANWPLLRTPTILLGDFLIRAFSNSTGTGKFKILEIGAGTGGTTKYIVSHLKSHGIPFEYTFTDISPSLVSAAKKTFKGIEEMKFEVLDIEKEPIPEHEGAFHVVIATNCIHATRTLSISLSNLRKMVREDGALTLVEITKNMFWLDIVVGLFEGWWAFEDGRTHALVSERHWEREMMEAGFGDVVWTDGESREAKTARIIATFPRARRKVVREKEKAQVGMETVVYKTIGEMEIHADVYHPVTLETSAKKLPIALMIHGGSHMIFSRKDIRPPQTRLLIEKGFLPVSLDHRLCPEVSLSEGPMVDVCDALEWARHTLPYLTLKQPVQIDGARVVVVGWSSGGQLAMSLAWTAPSRGLKPPEAILVFYCPTNYLDDWWRNPIQPIGAKDTGAPYDLLEGVQDSPITNYTEIGAWAPLSDKRILTDPRCRLMLHINWKAQTLPIILGGLPSKSNIPPGHSEEEYYDLPQPSEEKIREVNPRSKIEEGVYRTPTFLVHGTNDELIPWEQSQGTFESLQREGVESGFVAVQGAPHICDLSTERESEGWKAVERGYEFICRFV